jgi:plasmid stabilization system protein ParE
LEIELTSRAEADLIEIADFIAKDSPAAAERFVARLRHRIEVLRAFPEAGHRIRKRSNLRALVERPIIIV